jgi:hypothetical protein
LGYSLKLRSPSPEETPKQGFLLERLIAVLHQTTEVDVLSSKDLGDQLGLVWRKVSGDLVKHKNWEAVLEKSGWRYVPGSGRRPSQFERIHQPASAPSVDTGSAGN